MTEQLLMLNPRPESYLSLLDEKSIGKICEYMGLYDLMQFGELDMNYQRIIGEHIISKRTLDMSEISKHYHVRDVFRHYGEFMTELSIKESDIQYKSADYTYAEEMFRLIKKRCVAGKLEAVTIHFDRDPKDVGANTFLDVFKELNSLAIVSPKIVRNYTRDKPLADLLGNLLMHCTKLHSLKLQNLCSGVDFLSFQGISKSLKSLWLDRCLVRYESWLKFVKGGVCPLTALSIEHSMFRSHKPSGVLKLDHGEFLRRIVDSFPRLETFILINDDWLNWFVNPDYSSIGRLRNLKVVGMHSHIYASGNVIWLSLLVNPHLVEELAIELPERVELPIAISAFTNLHFVGFFDPIIAHLSVYTSFVALPRVTVCVLNVTDSHVPRAMNLIMLAIVMASERLQILKVFTPHSRKSFTSATYNDLVKKREGLFPTAPPLHLYAKFGTLKRYSPAVIRIYEN